MKKGLLFFGIIIGIITILIVPAAAKMYVWICPVFATNGLPDDKGVEPVVWGGDYVFEIQSEKENNPLLQSLLADLKEFGHGGLLLPDAKLVLDNKFMGKPLSYRKIEIKGLEMTLTRTDGKTLTINPKSDFFRRALYPVEPTEDNNWSGWPEK